MKCSDGKLVWQLCCTRNFFEKNSVKSTFSLRQKNYQNSTLCIFLGNGCVVIVLIASRGKMDVPRFLVCNLAMADFCMGLYLGFLAIVDAATLGEFRKHAISWQFSAGCQVSTIYYFWTVFSTLHILSTFRGLTFSISWFFNSSYLCSGCTFGRGVI